MVAKFCPAVSVTSCGSSFTQERAESPGLSTGPLGSNAAPHCVPSPNSQFSAQSLLPQGSPPRLSQIFPLFAILTPSFSPWEQFLRGHSTFVCVMIPRTSVSCTRQ